MLWLKKGNASPWSRTGVTAPFSRQSNSSGVSFEASDVLKMREAGC